MSPRAIEIRLHSYSVNVKFVEFQTLLLAVDRHTRSRSTRCDLKIRVKFKGTV